MLRAMVQQYCAKGFSTGNASSGVAEALSERARVGHGSGVAASKFSVVREEAVPELNCHATLLQHKKTGAQVMSVVSEEENKVFGISFRTPVEDDTGVPHVLEHSVLCGSRKYPCREPFVELLKSSVQVLFNCRGCRCMGGRGTTATLSILCPSLLLCVVCWCLSQTYLNALTYPDRTCYPVASPNTTDFYNLMDVYLDSVLHPRLTPEVLKQEGWHYEVAEPEAGSDAAAAAPAAAPEAAAEATAEAARLIYKGVVYNEMKGVFSGSDAVHHTIAQTQLTPDNNYKFVSGGDPRAIPSLTFEQFKAFHDRYYHPSNSYM